MALGELLVSLAAVKRWVLLLQIQSSRTACISSRFLFPLTWAPRRFLANFKHLLSLETFNNSKQRFSYGANPAISRTISRTNLTCLCWIPFLLEGFTGALCFVTRNPLSRTRPIAIAYFGAILLP